ncbi:hypothetical protein PVAP13_5NG228062 [Panicum virgatum]|uniref:Secreted protein n=1 Tax=Panicum virgatum TaxID=38727 RepID=A0A8T0RV73_PANVG|nr:hypothetical protein PVAP13_5NG228062 [Panicum virgatum]
MLLLWWAQHIITLLCPLPPSTVALGRWWRSWLHANARPCARPLPCLPAPPALVLDPLRPPVSASRGSPWSFAKLLAPPELELPPPLQHRPVQERRRRQPNLHPQNWIGVRRPICAIYSQIASAVPAEFLVI